MKRSLIIGLTSLVVMNAILLQGATLQAERTCEVGEAEVCYDFNLKAYAIEPEAKVTLQVANAAYGDALVALWDQTHPDHAGALSYQTLENESSTDLQYLSLSQAAFRHGDAITILDGGDFGVSDTLASELNTHGLTFVPMAGEGFAFLTNLDRLEAMAIAQDDVDQDGRIDAIDSFAKIQTLFQSQSSLASTLVFSLNEPFVFYPFLTSSGWQIFGEHEAKSPGFEKEAFLQALVAIESMSQFDWNGPLDNDSQQYTWAYTNALESGDFTFDIVSSWMFVEEKQAKLEARWQISALPNMTDDGQDLTPFLTNVSGYQISKDSLFPSAAHEALRLIRSQEGMQAFVDATQLIPLGTPKLIQSLRFANPTQGQFALAFTQSRTEPLIAFEERSTLPAFSLFYQINLMPILQQLWDHQLTPQEAQIQIMMASDAWLFEHLTVESEAIAHESQ